MSIDEEMRWEFNETIRHLSEVEAMEPARAIDILSWTINKLADKCTDGTEIDGFDILNRLRIQMGLEPHG